MMTSSLLLILLGAADGGTPLRPTAEELRAERAITARELRRHVAKLASDAFEGRGPGTNGDRLTQEYLAGQFHAMGLQPGAPDGGWVQPVDLVGVNGHPETLTVQYADGGTEALKFHDEFIAVAGKPQETSRLANAEVVFVGYGIIAPEFGWDDYKGVDVKGKVLLVMNSDPESDPELFAGKTRLWYGRWDYKNEIAGKLGAAGVMILHTRESAGYPWSVVQTSWTGEQFDLPGEEVPQSDVELWITEDAAKRMTRRAGLDLDALRAQAQQRDFRPVPLGVRFSTEFKNTIRTRQTANVIAKLPGSDPALAQQAVFFTAHHDHIGKAADAKPDEDAIYNGALDNASGTAQLLAVAKAFTALKKAPRRTLYFAAVAAEEQGLLGSQYLAQNPPVPAGRIAAVVNMDGANIWGKTRDVTVIGLGKSSLDALIERVAKYQRRRVTPDQMPDRGSFYRSDHFSFAKLGVPAVYAESGTDVIGRPPGWGKQQRELFEQRHYHQPSDELNASWNLDGAVQDAQLYFHLGRLIADGDAMPQWTPGDEFEDERKASFEALKR